MEELIKILIPFAVGYILGVLKSCKDKENCNFSFFQSGDNNQENKKL